MKLAGVVKGGPADKAGLKGRDIIVKFNQQSIENIYDYVYSLEAARPNVKTAIVVKRGDNLQKLQITPQARE